MNKMDKEQKKLPLTLPAAIVIGAVIISGSVMYKFGGTEASRESDVVSSEQKAAVVAIDPNVAALHETVIPARGVVLPVTWGDIGKRLVASGAIDAVKFAQLYEQREEWGDEYKRLLLESGNGKLRITRENSGYVLNLLWALGLANKNPILEKGEMSDPKYGGAGRFASTGGWSLTRGSAMEHYSMHNLVVLTPAQQASVAKLAKGIYRPCCGNSTHFPDCNHGMAMLGLLELMASQGVSEEDMWKTALAVNSFWFPDTYVNIATYMKMNGTEWQDVDPALVLGPNFSSASGARRIAAQVPSAGGALGGSGCGVGGATPAVPAPKQQGGCGI